LAASFARCCNVTALRGSAVDEKVAEEIRMHKETIATDSNTPLHLIREKELEISGRVLAAKRQADEVITEARKKGAELVATAEAEGGAGAEKSEAVIQARAEEEAVRLRADAKAEAAELSGRIDAHRAEAVRVVLDAVTTI
jgi:vacuolar-type H+-ATPase subunit H